MFDDNVNRGKRLEELVNDTQSIVADSKKYYASFLKENATLNTKLAAVYAHAGLQPPKATEHDVLAGQTIGGKVAATEKEVKVADIVVNMVGAGAMGEMAPAATAYLVDAGLLTEVEAGTAIASIFGTDITIGGAVGGIVGAVVVGLVGGAITTGIVAITGQNTAIELRGGIAAMKRMRLEAELSCDRLACIGDVVEASKNACDTLMDMDMLDDAAIQGLIENQAQPSLQKLQNVDRKSAITTLYHIDVNRGSWMNDG